MGPRVLACTAAVLGACNFVYGLDETRLGDASPRTIVLDNRASEIDLVDFPVMVVPTFPLRDVDPQTQLRFVDPQTSATLPFEVEQWDPDGGSVIWVRVPLIPRKSNAMTIEMHFGDGVTGAPDPRAVWAGYELVAHQAVAGGRVPDVANGHDAPGTFTPRPGVIGGAIGMPGLGTFANSGGLFDGWGTFTLELWLYPDYPSSNLNAEPMFLDRGRAITLGRIFEGAGLPDIVTAQVDCVFTNGAVQANTFVQLRRWSQLVITYDGQALYTYLNGTFSGIEGIGGAALVSGTSLLQIGHPIRPLAGMLDELRISRSYRPPDHVAAQFLSMTGRLASFL